MMNSYELHPLQRAMFSSKQRYVIPRYRNYGRSYGKAVYYELNKRHKEIVTKEDLKRIMDESMQKRKDTRVDPVRDAEIIQDLAVFLGVDNETARQRLQSAIDEFNT